MRTIIYIVLAIMFLPFAFAESVAVDTEFDIMIDPYNGSCNVEINTEGNDFDYNVSTKTNYNAEDIDFIRDLKCKDEKYFENMTNICTSLATQYSGLMENMHLVQEYAYCSGNLKSSVDLKEKFEKELSNMTTKYEQCNSQKEALLTQGECDLQIKNAKQNMLTEQQCADKVNEQKEKVNWQHAFIAWLVGIGLTFGYYEKYKKPKDIKEGIADRPQIRKLSRIFKR